MLICDLIEILIVYKIVYQLVIGLVSNPFRIHIWFNSQVSVWDFIKISKGANLNVAY